MGVVYEAIDREHDQRVALKTLRAMSADALLRFKTEFREFQDLQHPNLITVGELYCDDGEWFFTMELIDGINFFDHVRPSVVGITPGDVDDKPTVVTNPPPGPPTRVARRQHSTP